MQILKRFQKLKKASWQDILLLSLGVLLICSIIMLVVGVSAVPPTALKMPPMAIDRTYHTDMYSNGSTDIKYHAEKERAHTAQRKRRGRLSRKLAVAGLPPRKRNMGECL